MEAKLARVTHNIQKPLVMTSALRKLSTFAEIMRGEEEEASQARRYSSFQAAYIAMEDAYDDYSVRPPTAAMYIDNPLFEYSTTEEEDEGEEIPALFVRKRRRLSVLALVRRTITFKRTKTPPSPLPSFHALHGLEPPNSNKRGSILQRRSLHHGSLVM